MQASSAILLNIQVVCSCSTWDFILIQVVLSALGCSPEWANTFWWFTHDHADVDWSPTWLCMGYPNYITDFACQITLMSEASIQNTLTIVCDQLAWPQALSSSVYTESCRSGWPAHDLHLTHSQSATPAEYMASHCWIHLSMSGKVTKSQTSFHHWAWPAAHQTSPLFLLRIYLQLMSRLASCNAKVTASSLPPDPFSSFSNLQITQAVQYCSWHNIAQLQNALKHM